MSQLSRCENNSWLNVRIRADKADTVKPKMKSKSKSKIAKAIENAGQQTQNQKYWQNYCCSMRKWF